MARLGFGVFACAACLSALGLAVAAGTAAAAELPQRKAGLWQLDTVMDEGMGPRDQSLKMCIDGDMERNTVQASLAEHKSSCTRYDVTRDGDVTKVDADCQFSGRSVISETRMSGDFQSALKVEISSTTSGREKDRTITVKRTITQNGKYLGESCGDLQPGEAVSPDGTKVMVQ